MLLSTRKALIIINIRAFNQLIASVTNFFQTLLGIAVPVTYDIPGNVKLTYIYLTKQELEELKLTKMSLKLEKKPVFESLKTETLLSNEPTTSKAASELAESYADVPTVISQEHCQSNNVIKNENSDVSSSEFDSSTVLHNIYNEERERVSANFKDITTSYDCRTEARASNRHLSYDEPFTTSCDSLTTTSIPETSGTCSSELAHIESPGSTLDEDEGTDANQYVLYLQGYNDTLLILLLDQKTSEDATVIHGLVSILLSHIVQ